MSGMTKDASLNFASTAATDNRCKLFDYITSFYFCAQLPRNRNQQAGLTCNIKWATQFSISAGNFTVDGTGADITIGGTAVGGVVPQAGYSSAYPLFYSIPFPEF